MVGFTSRREQLLWIWICVIVVSVGATIGVAPRASGRLDGLVAIAFVVALALAVATVVAFARRVRAQPRDLGLLLAIAATYCLVFVRFTEATERSHLVEYGLIGLLVYEAVAERWGAEGRQSAVAALVIAGGLGIVDELVQLVIPTRVFDPIDIGVNLTAVVLAITARLVLARIVRRRSGTGV